MEFLSFLSEKILETFYFNYVTKQIFFEKKKPNHEKILNFVEKNPAFRK